DRDFVDLLERLGAPPQVIWITCGNTSNRAMRQILSSALPTALDLIRRGESLIEIGDAKEARAWLGLAVGTFAVHTDWFVATHARGVPSAFTLRALCVPVPAGVAPGSSPPDWAAGPPRWPRRS